MESPSSPVQKITNKISETYLPEELVTEIISNLPVKRVFQAQCLSKNFSSIATDPRFIDSHLRQSSLLRPAIILNRRNNICLIRCSNGLVSEYTVEEVPLHPSIKFDSSFDKMMIVASCNGLLVIAHSIDIETCFLWNPAINQCNELPVPSIVPVAYMDYKSVAWGFGYCMKSKVYKIVRIVGYPADSSYYVEVLSCTCGTDYSWRGVDNFDKLNTLPLENDGVTVNGVVYWVVSSSRLLAFDLSNEEFSLVVRPVPKYGVVMEFRGSLSMCCEAESNVKSFDLWVMKDEQGVKCSWEKIYTTVELDLDFFTIPARCLNDRQLLLLNSPSIYDGFDEPDYFECNLYDLKTKEIQNVFGKVTSAYPVYHNFVESLIPLYPPERDYQIDDGDKGINNNLHGATDYKVCNVMGSEGNIAGQE